MVIGGRLHSHRRWFTAASIRCCITRVQFHPVEGGDHVSPLFTATKEILAAVN
jgi:hypothetical protein